MEPLEHVINFLEKANEDDLAEQVLDVFSKYTNNLEQYNLIAKLYLDIRNVQKAEKYALKTLTLAQNQEQLYNSRANLAKMYNNVNEPAKSLFYSNLNKLVDSEDPDTKLETVFSLYLLNRKKESEEILREMKKIEDTLSEKHRDIVNFNLGTYNLEQGKFQEGLAGFLLNVKKLELWFSPRELPYKFWNGGIYPGKTLIMFMEGGGIGDEFITVRFMNTLKSLGFNPVYYTSRKDLYKIFNRCGYKTIMNFDEVPTDALWTYAMQVPLWLKLKPEQIKQTNYLFPSEEARTKWAFLKENKKIKIGVRWQGNSKNERELHRKVPIDDIMKYLKNSNLTDVEFYNLQMDDGHEDVKRYSEIIDITENITSFDDTLAICENLDYVVTSCTSVLHASAIVGTKTLALIPISAYFTWVSPAPDNTSIWYDDNLRLFKQVTTKKWDEPLTELCDFLVKDIELSCKKS